jgi:hypothetical protein
VPSIVGTWKLVRAVARDGSGATLPEPYGGNGIGRVTFTADGEKPIDRPLQGELRESALRSRVRSFAGPKQVLPAVQEFKTLDPIN